MLMLWEVEPGKLISRYPPNVALESSSMVLTDVVHNHHRGEALLIVESGSRLVMALNP